MYEISVNRTYSEKIYKSDNIIVLYVYLECCKKCYKDYESYIIYKDGKAIEAGC